MDLLNPVAEDIDILEIARALSQQCRYAGNIRRFYSVAQHSFLIAGALCRDGAKPEVVLAGLLHDAHEAYVGDIVNPVQQMLWHVSPDARRAFRELCRKLDDLICERAGLDATWLHDPLVREYDARILIDERKTLLTDPPPRPWSVDVAGMVRLGVNIWPCTPDQARIAWLASLQISLRKCGLKPLEAP